MPRRPEQQKLRPGSRQNHQSEVQQLTGSWIVMTQRLLCDNLTCFNFS